MSNTTDRRAPGSCRIPFDALVEVGGQLGPSFEAQAINLSEEGMSLRTAYLPEVGQPIMCRFDTGNGMGVVAAGEVLWKDDMGNGGEFGIRFTNLDGQSTVALQRVLGMENGQLAPAPGRKVRLHIEGLASPMRARIREQMTNGVTAYSDLGFLQMGRPLELEDASSGARRPALIDRVEVAVDDSSRIPQLVVSLRYDDVEEQASTAPEENDPSQQTPQDPPSATYEHHEEEDGGEAHADAPNEADHVDATRAESQDEPAPMPALAKDGAGEEEEEESPLKRSLAKGAAKVTPAILSLVKRAKTTATLLAARARKARQEPDDEMPVRRTTAPAPGGGLHASGRKVVRGSIPDQAFEEEQAAPAGRLKITKKKVAVAGSIAIATVLVGIALHKPAPGPQLAAAPPAESEAIDPTPANTSASPIEVAPLNAAITPITVTTARNRL